MLKISACPESWLIRYHQATALVSANKILRNLQDTNYFQLKHLKIAIQLLKK